MKRVLIALIAIIFLALAGLLIAPSFIDWSRYKDDIRTQIETATGYEVLIDGSVGAGFFPSPYARVENLTISQKAPAGQNPLLKLEKLDLNLAVMPLLEGIVAIRSLSLHSPEFFIKKTAGGRYNWQNETIDALMAGKEEDAAAAGRNAPTVSIQSLNVEGGTFVYDDGQSEQPMRFDDIGIYVQADDLKGPFKGTLETRYNGQLIETAFHTGRFVNGQDSVAINIDTSIGGKLALIEYDGIVTTTAPQEIQGEIALSASDVKALAGAFGADASAFKTGSLRAEGVIAGSADTLSLNDLSLMLADQKLTGSAALNMSPRIELDLKLQNEGPFNLGAILSDAVLKSPARYNQLEIAMTLAREGAALTMRDTTIRLDENQAQLTLAYTPSAQRPVLDIAVRSERFNLNPFQSEAGNENGGPEAAADTLKTLSLPFDLVYEISAGTLLVGPQTLTGLEAAGSLDENSLSLERFRIGGIKGASVSGRAKIENRSELNGITASLSLNAPNAGVLRDLAGIELPEAIPADRPLTLSTEVSGSAERLDTVLNGRMLDAELAVSGVLENPLKTVSASQLELQLKHPDNARFLKIFVPALEGYRLSSGALDFYADLGLEGNVINLTGIKAKVGQTDVSGTLSIESAAKPSIKGDIKFSQFTATPPAGQPSGSTDVVWSREALDMHWMHSLNLDLKLAGQRLQYGTWDLQNPVMSAVLNNGSLKLQDVSAGLYGGQMNLTVDVSASDRERAPVTVKSDIKMRGIAMEPVVYSFARSRLIRGEGQIDADINLSATGLSVAALVFDLSGKGTVVGRDLVIDGLDLERFGRALSAETKPGDSLLNIWKGTTSGGRTEFDTLDGGFTISEGVVNIAALDLDGPRANIATTGEIDLPEWTLETSHRIALKQREDIPDFTITFKGPLGNPAQTFAQGALQDYLQRKLERKLQNVIQDKVGGKLGEILGGGAAPAGEVPAQEQDNQSEQGSPAGPADAIRGILQNLGR